MKPGNIAFYTGLAVTIVTTLAHPGGLLGSFIVGTCSGALAVGVTALLLGPRP
jgi:hypothetical protein